MRKVLLLSLAMITVAIAAEAKSKKFARDPPKTCQGYFQKYDESAVDEESAARCDMRQSRLVLTRATPAARNYARCVCIYETQLWLGYHGPLWLGRDEPPPLREGR
jgi:hypothetical protein